MVVPQVHAKALLCCGVLTLVHMAVLVVAPEIPPELGRLAQNRRNTMGSRQLVHEPYFQASQHIPEILDYIFNFASDRDLDVFDCFSGEGHFAKVARHRGHQAETYDIVDAAEQNILVWLGFFWCLHLVLRIKRFLGLANLIIIIPLAIFKEPRSFLGSSLEECFGVIVLELSRDSMELA